MNKNLASKVTVVFLNNGDTMLQIENDGCSGNLKYGHDYDSPEQAAEDFITFLTEECTCTWEGNEEDSASFDPSLDEIKNGGCCTRSGLYLLGAANGDYDYDVFGYNERAFIERLKKILAE